MITRVTGAMIAGALGLAACSTTTPAVGTSTTSRANTASTGTSSGSTATTSTTLLPPPVNVRGTGGRPSGVNLGVVQRVAVVPVPLRQTTVTIPTVGSPGYSNVVRVAFRRVGTGPDLLLVAGQDATMTWWSPSLIQLLEQHYRVTTFDLPGVGYSGSPTGAPSIGSMADETAGLSAALGLSHPTLLGWGLGGAIALALAERHPALASHLVLADTGIGLPGSTRPIPSVRALMAAPATPAALSGLLFPSDRQAARAAWLRKLFAQVPDDLTISAARMEAALQAQVWGDRSLSGSLHHLALPALLVSGTADVVFPPADAGSLAASVPNVSVVTWPDAGYGSIIQDARLFVAGLERFTG